MSQLLNFVVATTLAVLPAAASASYVYSDITDFTSSIMIDPETGQGAIGDRGSPLELCPPSDAFKCFQIEGMLFSLPKSFDPRADRSTWQYRGHQFSASRAQGIKILGARYDIFFIDSATQSAPIRFWYSPYAGVIGIKGLAPKQDRVFLLQSKCGFASNRTCK
jgi:hypothetical protein